MPKYNGIIKKSRTLDLAAITAMVGTLIATLPQLQQIISPTEYGIGFVVLSVIQTYLRSVTTAPLGEKETDDQPL